MYTAKAAGKNRVAVFEPTMHAAIVARHALSAELSRSLGRGELVVFYQPIVDAPTGARRTGVEALVRWRHPTRGLIGPTSSSRWPRRTGVILALGRWVLEEACRQVAAWAPHGGHDRPLTRHRQPVRRSSSSEPTFVDDLDRILDRDRPRRRSSSSSR